MQLSYQCEHRNIKFNNGLRQSNETETLHVKNDCHFRKRGTKLLWTSGTVGESFTFVPDCFCFYGRSSSLYKN